MGEQNDISGTTDVKQMWVCAYVCVCLCVPLRDCISTKLDKSALIYIREARLSRTRQTKNSTQRMWWYKQQMHLHVGAYVDRWADMGVAWKLMSLLDRWAGSI